MKEYKSVVLNAHTTEKKLDELLKVQTEKGFVINCVVMGNMIIMEREVWNHLPGIEEKVEDTL